MSDKTQAVIIRAEERPLEAWNDPVRGSVSWHTLFSGDITPTGALTAGVALIEPRGGSLCPHRHEQPELYFILEGTGLLTVDGTERVVSAGTAVFIPGNAAHGLRNETDAPLKLLYVFPADRFSDVTYRFDEEASRAPP